MASIQDRTARLDGIVKGVKGWSLEGESLCCEGNKVNSCPV